MDEWIQRAIIAGVVLIGAEMQIYVGTAVPALARSRVRRYAPVAQGLAAARDVVDGAASTSPDRGLVIQLDRRRRGPPRLPAA